MRYTAAAFLLILLFGAPAAAQTASPSPTPAASAWRYYITPYLWLPNINGELTFQSPPPTVPLAGVPVIRVHDGPSSYLQNLNSAVMLAFYAAHNGTSLATDIMYVNTSTSKATVDSVQRPDGTIEIPANTSTSSRFRGTVWTLDIGQSVNKTSFSPVEVLGGVRFLGATASADWNFQEPLDVLPATGSVSKKLNIWDPIVGLRGKLGLGAHWYVPYYADYGGGSGNNTFQALVGIANSNSWGDIVLASRWLQYYFNNKGGNENIQLVGPTLGVRIRF